MTCMGLKPPWKLLPQVCWGFCFTVYHCKRTSVFKFVAFFLQPHQFSSYLSNILMLHVHISDLTKHLHISPPPHKPNSVNIFKMLHKRSMLCDHLYFAFFLYIIVFLCCLSLCCVFIVCVCIFGLGSHGVQCTISI